MVITINRVIIRINALLAGHLFNIRSFLQAFIGCARFKDAGHLLEILR